MEPIDISQTEEIFSVSRLNRDVRYLLEASFTTIWVEGELSNFMVPSSGHWYFSLKDSLAQVRCAMFKPQNRKLDFIPKDGMHVMLKARVSLYEGRGEFQLLAEHMEEMGEGQLRRAFEALKKRLYTAGLFDATHKKPLPAFPRCIGVITSPTGAAIRDILSVLCRRFAAVPVIIYPTLVQGEQAASQITEALQLANRRQECDVLIVARGGGSLEDLWPFNEESVAQAIFASDIPIISGVGHEIDFTIADFVADVRAPTPSAAAELVTPDRLEFQATLQQYLQRLQRHLHHKLQQLQQQVQWTNKQLHQQHPKHRLLEQKQNLDGAETTLLRLQKQFFQVKTAEINLLASRLQGLIPTHQIRALKNQLQLTQHRITQNIHTQLQYQRQALHQVAATLDAISPLATLQRGYAIVSKEQQVLRTIGHVGVGETIQVQLTDGELDCEVTTVRAIS